MQVGRAMWGVCVWVLKGTELTYRRGDWDPGAAGRTGGGGPGAECPLPPAAAAALRVRPPGRADVRGEGARPQHRAGLHAFPGQAPGDPGR